MTDRIEIAIDRNRLISDIPEDVAGAMAYADGKTDILGAILHQAYHVKLCHLENMGYPSDVQEIYNIRLPDFVTESGEDKPIVNDILDIIDELGVPLEQKEKAIKELVLKQLYILIEFIN